MAEGTGYLLPDGDAFEDELDCTLVFYPSRNEYRIALLGALSYFATWIAWEKDDSKRGKDAADSWRLALDATLECWRMACLENLLEDVAAIRDLLANKKDCCDENITYLEQDEITTEIEPEVGDPPDYYGETAVSDWDDWLEHVCYNAHAYVDQLKHISTQIDVAVVTSSLVLGMIAAALVLLSFTGIGLPISFGLAATVVTGLIAGATISTFQNTPDDIEDSRQAIVCALLQGTSLADAVEDALGSDDAWDLFYQFIDYDSATAIIYEGGLGTEYLPADKKDDCVTCDYEQYLDGDLYFELLYGTNTVWDDVAKHWTSDSEAQAGCNQFTMYIYTDDTKSTPLECRIEVVSCSKDTSCGGVNHHRGYDSAIDPVYSLNHPTLPNIGDGAVHVESGVHNQAFTIVYRLFHAS